MPFAQTDGGFTAIHSEARVNLGECQMDRETNDYWAYLKASIDLEKGQAVSPSRAISAFAPDKIEPAAAGSTVIEAKGVDFLTANSNAIKDIDLQTQENYHENLLVIVTGGAGIGQVGIVHQVLEDELTVFWADTEDGKLVTALDNTSTLAFSAPWYAKKSRGVTTNISDPVIGFAQQKIEKHEYFWALCKGLGVGRRTLHANTPAIVGGDALTIGTGNINHGLITLTADALRRPIASAEMNAAAGADGPAVIPITADTDYPISVVMPKRVWLGRTAP